MVFEVNSTYSFYNAFNGVFDGNYFKIKNLDLSVTSSRPYSALFALIGGTRRWLKILRFKVQIQYTIVPVFIMLLGLVLRPLIMVRSIMLLIMLV